MGSRNETVETAEVDPAGTARPPWLPYGSKDSPKKLVATNLYVTDMESQDRVIPSWKANDWEKHRVFRP